MWRAPRFRQTTWVRELALIAGTTAKAAVQKQEQRKSRLIEHVCVCSNAVHAGARMLARMGWQPGQGLGKQTGSAALVLPKALLRRRRPLRSGRVGSA